MIIEEEKNEQQRPKETNESVKKGNDIERFKEHIKKLEEEEEEIRLKKRLEFWGIDFNEIGEENFENLKCINEEIKKRNVFWMFSIIDEIKRMAEQKVLLELLPEDVDIFKAIAEERGMNFEEREISASEAEELATMFMKRKNKKGVDF